MAKEESSVVKGTCRVFAHRSDANFPHVGPLTLRATQLVLHLTMRHMMRTARNIDTDRRFQNRNSIANNLRMSRFRRCRPPHPEAALWARDPSVSCGASDARPTFRGSFGFSVLGWEVRGR